MAYVIATYQDGLPYAVHACGQTNSFLLVALDSDVALNKIFSHPYRAGAYNILSWIEKNDDQLSGIDLDVYDEAKFRK
jgi:hypothetical protein